MVNGNGNGNGEIKKLVGLKHDYKDEVTRLEEDLKTKFDQSLTQGKKDLKDKYLEKLVDWFYSNGFNGQTSPPETTQPTPAVDVTSAPTPIVPVVVDTSVHAQPVETGAPDNSPQPSSLATTPVLYCDECGAQVLLTDRYCSQCAVPLGVPVKKVDQTTPAKAFAAGRVHTQRRSP